MKTEKNSLALMYLALLALHFIILSLLLAGRLDFLFNDAMHRLGAGTDFAAYYNAGASFLRGHGIYGHGPGFGFRYHPAIAGTVFAALSSLPFEHAYHLWVVVQELAFLALLLLIHVTFIDNRHRLMAAACLVLFTPLYLEIHMGNASLVAMALLAWALHFRRRSQPGKHAALFFASLLVKPVGLLLLPAYFLVKDYRGPAIILAVFVLTALPFFYVDPSALYGLLSINVGAIPLKGWVIHAGNLGLHGFIVNIGTRLAGIPTHELAAYGQLPPLFQVALHGLLLATVMIAGAVSVMRKPDIHLALFFWWMIYILAYKDVWEHSYTLMLLSCYLLYVSKGCGYHWIALAGFVSAAPTAFVFYDVDLPPGPFDPEHYWQTGVSVLHHATKAAPALILYALMVWKVLVKKRAGGS